MTGVRTAYVLVVLLLATLAASAVPADAGRVLNCEASGPSNIRTLQLTIIPPKDSERLNLWALKQDTHEPGSLIKESVAIGEVEIDDGTDTVRRDLYFLTVGKNKATSHEAFWQSGGTYRHPTFLVVDLFEDDIAIRILESAGTRAYMTGECNR